MLQEFFIKRAEHLIFVGALAGQIEPFVTFQNYAGSKIPVRLLNLDDFAQGMKRQEYRLLKKHAMSRHVWGLKVFCQWITSPKSTALNSLGVSIQTRKRL